MGPSLDDGSPATTPLWEPSANDANDYSQRFDGTANLDICPNSTTATQHCYHIKFQLAYCECAGDWGDVNCGTNILEATSDAIVWISAGERRGGLGTTGECGRCWSPPRGRWSQAVLTCCGSSRAEAHTHM